MLIIYRFSDTGFRTCFRMGRASFRRLIHLCENTPGATTIIHQNSGAHSPPRPIYQHIATALYIFSASGGSAERVRIFLDIGYGTIWDYPWRFTRLLVHLLKRYIAWPSLHHRWQLPALHKPRQEIFSGCVWFLEGSEIPLQSKPAYDHETYSSRNKIYSFNLSSYQRLERTVYICEYRLHCQHSWFNNLQGRSTCMSGDEYLLAGKADQLNHHVITPHKEPVSRRRSRASFNYVIHSTTRGRIELSSGVLKARCTSLR